MHELPCQAYVLHTAGTQQGLHKDLVSVEASLKLRCGGRRSSSILWLKYDCFASPLFHTWWQVSAFRQVYTFCCMSSRSWSKPLHAVSLTGGSLSRQLTLSLLKHKKHISFYVTARSCPYLRPVWRHSFTISWWASSSLFWLFFTYEMGFCRPCFSRTSATLLSPDIVYAYAWNGH